LKSEEYDFPFYGWLPDKMRYKLRISKQGPKIMRCGIDFHQFTYPKLIKIFNKIGFKAIYTPFEFLEAENFNSSIIYKIAFILGKKFKLLRYIILQFMPLTYLVSIK